MEGGEQMKYIYKNNEYTIDAELYLNTDDVRDLYLIGDEADDNFEVICVADLPEDIQLDIIEIVFPEELYYYDEVDNGTF